jgi:hypothetical protein
MLGPMRRILLAAALLLVFTVAAHADGDPASDVLVFKKYFLPYAPQTPSADEQKINVATEAADRAGLPIRVAVISGPGDLGVVPQYTNKPQDYAKFLGDELKFAYKGPLLIVMQNGYGLSGTDDAAMQQALGTLPKPKSNDPADLADAGAAAVVALAKAGGKTLDLSIAAPANAAPATTPHTTQGGSDSSNTTAIVLIAGGTVGLLVALGGLFWWVRRAPEEEAA